MLPLSVKQIYQIYVGTLRLHLLLPLVLQTTFNALAQLANKLFLMLRIMLLEEINPSQSLVPVSNPSIRIVEV